jgi:hypothetical protein
MKKIFGFKNTTADWVLMGSMDVVRGYKGLTLVLNKTALHDGGTITVDSADPEKIAQAERYLTQGPFKNFFTLIEKAIPVPD